MPMHVAHLRLRYWCIVVIFLSSPVLGSTVETFGFRHIQEPGDGPAEIANGATGEAQLFVDVIDEAPGQVLFKFRNIGPIYCRITGVYFDDGSLLGIAGLIDIDDGAGGDGRVDFSQGGSPGNLPGGNNLIPPFDATDTFLATSDAPGQSPVQHPYKPGVEPPDQWLGILFNLQEGRSFADVIDELNSGELLRIGLHVTSFPDGGSESFVNVPEPTVLGLLLLGSLALLRRKGLA